MSQHEDVAATMTTSTLLPFVSKPGRYLGEEFNSVTKNWEQTATHVALAFPDLYEIGMSHLGLQILYHILNAQSNILAERCYCPDLDAERLMQENDLPLISLESNHPIHDFDLFAITLPFELCYTNIISLLKYARIPLYQKERNSQDPFVLGGGSCAFNPEPVAEFFDAILLGDGEDAILAVADVIQKGKKENLERADILDRLAEIEGIYIPSHFAPIYTEEGHLQEIQIVRGKKQNVRRCILPDLNRTEHLHHPLVPNAKIVHDRLGIEIARGCTRGCRFCQAGIIYRPVRERSVEQILDTAAQGIKNSGFEELALLSLSTGDYSCINELLPQIMNRYAESYVSVSMPSMRVGTLSQEVMDQIKRVRKTGFTVAPEAGSERMRQVINKGITEEDLLTTCTDAFTLGWNTIKLYFMIGMPTETEEDVAAIIHLAEKILYTTKGIGGRSKQLTVSVGTFVPKPHTPFQWERQITMEETREKVALLRKTLSKKNIKLKYHDPETSFLEGVFSRGDRRLSKVIECAWNKGARLDSWSDHFSLPLWREAAQETGIVLDDYLRERSEEELLPWHHLDCGVTTSFLLAERNKSRSLAYTPDCRYHGCQQCGLCDFKIVRPHVVATTPSISPSRFSEGNTEKPQESVQHFKYMVTYTRKGDISYLGHLETLQVIFRTLRRAEITTNFSQGFNPTPKVSFANALPVGMESDAEYFVMDLPSPLQSAENTKIHLNKALPPGLTVTDIRLHSGELPLAILTQYDVFLPSPLLDKQYDAIIAYNKRQNFPVSKIRKGKQKEIDIRSLFSIREPLHAATQLSIALKSKAGVPGVKITEALCAILQLEESEILRYHIKKTAWESIEW